MRRRSRSFWPAPMRQAARARRAARSPGHSAAPGVRMGLLSAPETGTTFEENALLKARHAAQATGLPALADDSGLEVDGLGGRPGVYSARFAGADASDESNNRRLLSELASLPDSARGARYRCVLALVRTARIPPRCWQRAAGAAASVAAPRAVVASATTRSSSQRGGTHRRRVAGRAQATQQPSRPRRRATAHQAADRELDGRVPHIGDTHDGRGCIDPRF